MSSRPKHSVQANSDGSVTIQYKPAEPGIHELNLSYNDKPVEGTPFRCHVDHTGSNFVTAYGDGLTFGLGGQACEFTVVGGGSDLSVTVDGPSKADVTKKDAKNGLTDVSFLPLSPGEYNVSIKVKGKHIHGSPFSSKVSGEGRKRSQLSLTASSEVALGGKNIDLTNMVGKLKLPSGSAEPCLLKKMADGQLGIASFIPKIKGKYTVEVTQEGKAVSGSPFVLDITDSNVASASKVKINGDGLKAPMANKQNEIHLNVAQAGYGAIAVSIEGAHRSDIEAKDLGNNDYRIFFKPHEPGIYLCNIRFGDEPVPGSPFMLNAGGEASGRVRATKCFDIKDAEATGPGSKCEFQLVIPGTDPLDMNATLTAPNGKTELCEIADMPGNIYDIKFVPEIEGIHTVSLKHKGLHIAGSPFQYTVGKPPSAGAHKVEIGGPGLEKGEVKQKCEFNIYTREAGAGALTVAVEGPSKAELDVVDRGHGYTTVAYTVTKEGEYGVHVKFNDEHVPDSPSKLYVCPESGDARLATVHGLRDRGLDVDKAATFTIQLNGGKGNLKTYCDTPAGTEEDLLMQELDRETFACRFIPKENGIFYMNIKLNEAHIPGSPFPVLIGKQGADPALVLANGQGLEKGVSGQAAKFTVVTTNAGTGMLYVQMEGPSKCAITCTEVEEGYEFAYTPMAPGDYLITIKYCNITIAGCPTKAAVTGKGTPSAIKETSSLVVETVEKKPGQKSVKRFTGDASKVQASGNGLKKAFANRLANYTINVKDAGNAILLVGIISPTGNPVEEITTKKMKPTQYQVNYKTKEKGEHHMSIRWGNDDIPGSPFTVGVA